MINNFIEWMSQPDIFLVSIPLASAMVGVAILRVIDIARERKKKTLKPTPRPNRVPYDSGKFRR